MNKLKQNRNKQELTQKQLAKKTGSYHQKISDIETGKLPIRKMSIEFLDKLAITLELTNEEVLEIVRGKWL